MGGLADRENKRKKAGTIARMVEQPTVIEKREDKKAGVIEYKRTTIYIRPDQHVAIKMRAAQGNKEEKDISMIIRNAIDLYLSEKE